MIYLRSKIINIVGGLSILAFFIIYKKQPEGERKKAQVPHHFGKN
jgi:hypothetical protein